MSDQLSQEIKEIKIRLEGVEKVLGELVEVIRGLNKTTSRMDDHISFVENTYDKLKYPLNVLKNSVEKIFPTRDALE